MNNIPFTLSQVRPVRDAMTVSRPSGLSYEVPVTWFSLGAGTSITPEYYDCTTLYLGGEGNGKFLLGVDGQEVSIKPGEVLYVPPKTLCGTKTDSGMIYTEIILKKENFTMNNIIKAGQPTELKNLISYEEGSIANLDIAHHHRDFLTLERKTADIRQAGRSTHQRNSDGAALICIFVVCHIALYADLRSNSVFVAGNRDHRVRSKSGNDLAVHHQINLFRVIGCNFDITCHDRFLLS